MLSFKEYIEEGFFSRKKPVDTAAKAAALDKLHKIIFSPEANDRSAWDALHPNPTDHDIIGDALLDLVKKHLAKTRTTEGKLKSRTSKKE